MRRVPSDAEWQRLALVFGVFFTVTLAVAVVFITASPFPPVVAMGIMSPIVVPTGWIWIMVILRRDVDRLERLNEYAARRRSRRRRRR